MKNLRINSILNMIKTVSSIIFPLITFPYISRVLMPDNVGKINFSLSFISYFSMIASLGITTYAIRECSSVRDNKDKLSEKASELFSINLCTTGIAYLLLLITLIFFRQLDSYRTLIVIQSISIVFVTLGADWINTAMEDFAYITIRTILFQIISLVLMFVFVKDKNDYLVYAAISVISSSGANIVNIFYRKRYCSIHFTLDMKWETHLKSILLLFVMVLAQTIFSSADVTMLGIMKNDYEVGIYSTAHKIENILAQVVSSLAWVFMPRMSVLFANKDFSKINELLERVLKLLMFVGIPSVVGVCMLSKEIVIIIGGEKFADAALPLSILMFSFAFSLIGGTFLGNMVLLPSKNEKIYMIICCITAIVNIILNYILIPRWGSCAAAFTTAVSSFIIMLLLMLKKDKHIRLNYIRSAILTPLIGAIAIIFYCLAVGLFISNIYIKVFVSVLGSIALYGGLLLILKNEICVKIFNSVRNRVR